MSTKEQASTVSIKQKHFHNFITAEEIQNKNQVLGEKISADYKDKYPIFIGVLNGSFMFAADLMKHVNIPSEITFVKLASYIGTKSSGKVLTLLGLDIDIKGRHVIIIEDIVDTGKTLHKFMPVLQANEPASVRICSLLTKPEALMEKIHVDYVGFEIPNLFVVGYGLDFDGEGRNLKSIYQESSKI